MHVCFVTPEDYFQLVKMMGESSPPDSKDDTADEYEESESGCGRFSNFRKAHRMSLKRPNHSKYAKTLLLKWLTSPSHFFNPYPCATTKQTLAKETNLREEQIANWFVNTRKRFLTPIMSDLHQKYGSKKIEVILTKPQLYAVLKDLLSDKVSRSYTPWLTAFLSDPCFCWLDECSV